MQQNLKSFAALPLQLEGVVVGCISLYSRSDLSPTVLQELGSVSNSVALYIQRKQVENALETSERRYVSIVSNIREVVFQVNEFGYWTFLNPAWTATTGLEIRDTLGRFFLDALHPEDRDAARDAFLKLINGEREQCELTTRIFTRAGETRSFDMFLRIVHDSNKAVAGIVGSLSEYFRTDSVEPQESSVHSG